MRVQGRCLGRLTTMYLMTSRVWLPHHMTCIRMLPRLDQLISKYSVTLVQWQVGKTVCLIPSLVTVIAEAFDWALYLCLWRGSFIRHSCRFSNGVTRLSIAEVETEWSYTSAPTACLTTAFHLDVAQLSRAEIVVWTTTSCVSFLSAVKPPPRSPPCDIYVFPHDFLWGFLAVPK
jgi:hypothetical protein